MRPGSDAWDMQKGMAMALIMLILLPFVSADVRTPDESREANGGHAILLEQYTATWCDTCATVDPWISEFVDDHSSRIVRVALHPDDHDPFGSPLTTKRVALKQADHSLSLPTFWFDGQGELEGSVTQSLLENELRSAEGNREHWIGMQVWWDTWYNQPHGDIQTLYLHLGEELPENAKITIFRLETLEMTSENISYNGIDTHHDVATQMITFTPNGTILDSFDGEQGWEVSNGNLYSEGGIPVFIIDTTGTVDSFVTVIEVNEEVRGVIGISNEEILRKAEKSGDFALLLLLGVLVGSSIALRREATQ
ncbi:MAG: thioredoxin family protein [Candidatus Poseidoniales archaeon]|nr:thioredoxin family protein [Candidatus Poseidoniales archaeon]